MNMMGASSTVSNILYSYFNFEKNKLIWTGSLETLKAFVLTEIDEETAESTTWRSPSGGKWLFDSKLLSATWLTKSQNIHFDGEKGSDLMERIHSFLKQDPDNTSEIASPAELWSRTVDWKLASWRFWRCQRWYFWRIVQWSMWYCKGIEKPRWKTSQYRFRNQYKARWIEHEVKNFTWRVHRSIYGDKVWQSANKINK